MKESLLLLIILNLIVLTIEQLFRPGQEPQNGI